MVVQNKLTDEGESSMNKNMLVTIMFLAIFLNCFGKEFKYRDYEYSKYERVSMEYSSHSGEIFIEESPKNISLKISYDENDIINYIKLGEKDWKKFLEISDIYISFSNMADREEIKIDKYIDSIENISAGYTEGTKEEKIKAVIKFYVISRELNNHNLVFSIVQNNGKIKKLYFSKEQVIELQNIINPENIKAAILDNSSMEEELGF